MMTALYCWIILLLILYWSSKTEAQSGFLSLDCGATKNYTDPTNNISWVPDTDYVFSGSTVSLSINTSSLPLRSLRQFSNNLTKNCYVLPAVVNARYLIRATFFYGTYDGALTNPIFSIALDATTWTTVTITNATFPYFEEIIAFAQSTSFSVCLLDTGQGTPFISSLELRPLTGAIYGRPYLNVAYLSNKMRVNYGASSAAAVRYPDDPVDRIWVSDQATSAQGGDLQNLAQGTISISTTHSIDISQADDQPPEAVMQTAVEGTEGQLSYRYTLDGFPSQAYAVTYFAEIQQLKSTDIRSFTFNINTNDPTFVGQPLNVQNDAGGAFIAFEPKYNNVTLPHFVIYSLNKDSSSTLNPTMNAQEVYEIVPKVTSTSTQDVSMLTSKFAGQLPPGESKGDPCLPASWDWVTCNAASPPRVTSILLSGRNITGSIPYELSSMTGLQSISLDSNDLTGSIPDLSPLTNLQILHLQDNHLSGQFPQWLANLPNLAELWVENNQLDGKVPQSLLNKPGLSFKYSGNPNLCSNSSCYRSSDINVAAVAGGAAGSAFVFLIGAAALGCFFWRKRRSPQGGRTKFNSFQGSASLSDPAGRTSLDERQPLPGVPLADQARYFQLAELREATKNFSQKIGEGGFGPVFYGKTKDGHEVAVKMLARDSHQGAREFFNEVSLLSRVHHRNLVALIGYCHDVKEQMLVYEYMSKGSLHDHLHELTAKMEPLDWITRLKLALQAAKGLEYLHKGCNPSIIHRDVKSKNILLNDKMVAKVADFGLSKWTSDEVSYISSTIQGTVGYLDPEYYQSQQLTMKSDVYSFGVVLLEMLSGREALSPKGNPSDFSLVNWARSHLQKGDLEAIVDPTLDTSYNVEAMWKFAELAILSVEPLSYHRPDISEVAKEISEAIQLETSRRSIHSEQHSRAPSLSSPTPRGLDPSSLVDADTPLPLDSSDLSRTFESFVRPSAR